MDVYVDGSGKNGRYCYLILGKKPKIFREELLTNNQAEYKAIIAALQELKHVEMTIYSDSLLAVKQLDREYKIRNSELRKLASKVRALSRDRDITFKWIPREENFAGKVLDKLAKDW
ncbi:reverse transcriptase-like protein [Candidatus Bathyarchaeota archaeon]|nr:reverse transcriptase-like protein [Candidatus Bathyarchaeota archaeon]